MNPVYLHRTLRFIFVIGAVVAGAFALFFVSKVTYPFIIGFLIAFMMNPLVNFFQTQAKMPRALAVFISLLLIMLVFAGMVTLLVVEIASGAEYLAKVVPEHLITLIDYIEHLFAAQLIPIYNQLTGMFQSLESGQQDTIMDNIQNVGATIGTTAGNFIKDFFEKIPNILSWFPNAATVLIFSLLGTFFISKDWYRLSSMGTRILPNRARTSSKTVFDDLKKALFGFVRAQATLVSITTVIILIGLLILRIDYAITIALVTGIVDIIPYLGTGAVFVPWIIYEAIAGEMSTAIGLGILYVVVLVQRQIMEPKILSSSIGLDPLATLIALFVGFKTIGFLGLIVGPVILVIFNTLQRANVFQDIWSFIKGKDEVIIK
ncbi:sporulation integral membrane protein YtvI [Mesobacillus subterraneus]|uniref:sporulation integral membrane protein YtvI n=1 Tax=Mesobacillus subterraneus TaxID=285983 RepID=UPI00203D1706|nr:sporulation integral membrane protein YtvI [Mesobacillus subterraneus]MCM3572169.1 sporulation integral membrane protein YtvI [Mesobacillus subterraneus]